MSASILYYLDKNKDGEEVACADWEWHGGDSKKDGRICAAPDGVTNPISNGGQYVATQITGEGPRASAFEAKTREDIPSELRWKSPDGYSSFSQAFELFKSRISGVATIPDSAPEKAADPHAGQVYNPITEKWSWGF